MVYKITRTPPDELRHYGTKGQHWGHRKYQHEDGTWTPEGQKRYSTDTDGEYGEPGGERSTPSERKEKPVTEHQIKKDLKKEAKREKRRKRGRNVVEKESKRKLTPSQKVINTGFKALNAYWAIDSFRSDWM